MIDSPRYHLNLTKSVPSERSKVRRTIRRRSLKGKEMFSVLFENRPTTTNKPETRNCQTKFAFGQTVVFLQTVEKTAGVSQSFNPFGFWSWVFGL